VATLKGLRNAGHASLQLNPWQTQAGKRLSKASKNEVNPQEKKRNMKRTLKNRKKRKEKLKLILKGKLKGRLKEKIRGEIK